MQVASVICIVPRLPPAIDGIGDYTFRLWQHWPEAVKGAWHFLTQNWRDVEANRWSGATFGPLPLDADNLSAVLERSGSCHVVLHYVGYGYHSHGFPFGLVAGLSRWRKKMPGRRLTVFFHELWSSGPPWSSVFYVHWLQRHMVQQLHRIADIALTSTHRMQIMLEAIQSGKTRVLPIPSNIASLETASLRQRKAFAQGSCLRIVIFGQPGPRLKAINMHEKLLVGLQKQRRLGCVVIAGKQSSADCEDVKRLLRILPDERVVIRGQLPEADIATEFNKADIFLSFYPASLLTKSTAAMSSLANGCPVVLTDGTNPQPLLRNEHFLACDGSDREISTFLDDLKKGIGLKVSDSGRRWYRENADWPVVAEKWMNSAA